MRRPIPIFLLFVAAYVAALGWGWLRQNPSGGELPGHEAKIRYFAELIASGGGIPAWLPGYLSGTSASTILSFILAVPVYLPGILLLPAAGLGMKVTALILLALGAIAACALGRRLTGCDWTGAAIGALYLLAPQCLLRTGWQEHLTVIVAIPLVPLAFLALLRVAERGSPFDGLLFGAVFSATLLAWSKMGATLVIPLGIFSLWLFLTRPECRGNLVRGACWAVGATSILGILPLLPLLRERQFMTVFELNPMAVYQSQYSVKTATSWLDRGGALFSGLPPYIKLDQGGYYLGIVGLAAMAVVIVRTWRAREFPRELRTLRVFVFIALVVFWISYGPRSVIAGQFEFLDTAMRLPDAAIPLVWLTLAAQGFVLFWCLPDFRWRLPVFLAALVIYLFVPAFRVIELLPVYEDLRAPDSFWILNGTLAWSVCSGIAIVWCLRLIPGIPLRAVAGAATLALATWDSAAYAKWFFRGGLDGATFADFDAAIDCLNRDLPPGRVFPVSGRYFYLQIPIRTGHPLAEEALNSYLATRDAARLLLAGRLSASDMLACMRLDGVSGVFVEKHDPDVAAKTVEWWRDLLPVACENEHFVILKTAGALFPAFFANEATPAVPGLPAYPAALRHAQRNVLTIAAPDGLDENPPGLLSPEKAAASTTGSFTVLAEAAGSGPGRALVPAPGKDGWVVLSQAWHPDWTARVDGAARTVYRGGGAFPAVAVRAADKQVEFEFRPPAWAPVALILSGAGWCATLALLGLTAIPVLPRRFRDWFRAGRRAPVRRIPQIQPRPPIAKPLVIIPTYNERPTITALIDQILATLPALEILVIDDRSPDGTATAVSGHAAFGSRLHLLDRPEKLGLGSAYRDGFRWAIERGHDACVEIDADLSHDPADIPRLIARLDEGFDAAIGSRYAGGVRVINWPQHRLLLSAAASRYVRILTGLPLTDATSGFKAIRVETLRHIDWSELRADGYGFQIELHWLIWTAGGRIAEVPIVFTERREGQTKMTTGIAIEAAVRVLQLAMRRPARSPGESPHTGQ